MQLPPEIARLDEGDLTLIVARVFHTGRARVVAFEAEPIGYWSGEGLASGEPAAEAPADRSPKGEDYKISNPVSEALVRFRGTAVVHGEPRPWSLVLKALRDPGETEWNARRFARSLDASARERLGRVGRWDRERDAYASGLLADLGDGLAAPRCYRTDQREGGAWLWLEDVGPEDVARWDVARYALAARHLGHFNAMWLADLGRPRADWWSRDAIEDWVEALGSTLPGFLGDDACWSEPTVRAELPANARDELGRLWARRSQLFALLGGLPQGFAHLDAFRGNLLSRARPGGQQTVAIDWSFAGLAPVGAEVSQLVCASLFYLRETLDPAQLDRETHQAYVEGLREGGWRGDPTVVRIGNVVASVARWSFLVFPLALARDPEVREQVEARSGVSYREHIARLGRKIAFVLERAKELGRLV